MDANNIAFYFRSKNYGYPAGGWGESVFDAMLGPKKHRFEHLVEIYNQADADHSADLDRWFGLSTRGLLVDYYDGNLSRDEAIQALTPMLDVLPYLLLLTFPDVKEAIVEYARSSPVYAR